MRQSLPHSSLYLRVLWKSYCERCSSQSEGSAVRDGALTFLDDIPAYGKSQTCAAALGGEIRREQLAQILFLHSRSIVIHNDVVISVCRTVPQCDDNFPLCMQWELFFVGTARSTYLTDPFDLFFLFSLLLFLGGFCFKIYTTMCILLTEF